MIHIFFVANILSVLMAIISLFMLIPLGIAVLHGETASIEAFYLSIAVSLLAAAALYLLTRKKRDVAVSPKDGFLMVALSWVAASLVGALPFMLSGAIPLYTDAFFETMSGFTTTGASILTDIESLPRSMLFWRSLTHWLGGMGIVVLTVAVLPILGIGGAQLVRAEAPGPTLEKISHSITTTAKYLWLIYVGFTVLQTVLLRIAGMDWFDSLTHTFGTLATGGFSPKGLSVGHYQQPSIQIIITVFMVIAGLNFGLYFRLIKGNIRDLVINTEAKAYVSIFIAATLLVSLPLAREVYSSYGEALRHAAFQSASILTTTGFATADFDLWPAFSRIMLFTLMFVGGCSGSTGGGIKVIRIVTLFKQAANEIRYLLHPRQVYRMRINGSVVRKDFIFTVSGFLFLYLFLLLLTSVVVASGGNDLTTSFSTALATLGNIGPGFGGVGPAMNYAFFPGYIKWFLSFIMMAGRLEVYTVMAIFTLNFWKR
jgi:trk system potassium uptake protein